MFAPKIFLLFGLLVSINGWWFPFGDTELKGEETSNSVSEEKRVIARFEGTFKHVPFEMKTVDDRLIKEADLMSQMSNLDSCYHRVMAELEGSCESMSEEEMSKLSVQLLNCQSFTEGRPIFPCTSEMTIAECTTDMDSIMWNSYHIVSNRARAICYQIRQQQFRLKAELTVNKLMETTEVQLTSLKEMESTHVALKETTESAMKKMMDGQDLLLDRQAELGRAQLEVELQIERNMEQLAQEKILIVSENEELMKIAEKIHDKLSNATEKLSENSVVQAQRHSEVLEDLERLSAETRKVIEQLSEGSDQAQVLKKESESHFESVVNNLKVINGSVAHLASLVESVKYFMNDKFQWVTLYVEMTGKDINFISLVLLHVLYLFGVLLLLSFFNVHSLFKLLLLALVVGNVVSLNRYDQYLSFSNLTVALIVSLTGYYIFSLKNAITSSKKTSPPAIQKYSSSSDVEYDGDNLDEDLICNKAGLSKGDIQKVITVLEKLKGDGKAKGEADDCQPTTVTQKSEPIRTKQSDHIAEYFSVPDNPPSTPSRISASSLARDHQKGTPASVKRHLLKSFERDGFMSRESSRNNSPVRTSTPRHKSPSRLNDSTMNKSNRPQCSSTTKSGAVCRLPCQEGSFFCHVHNNSFKSLD